jgi:Mn2+/Fe2+ NRAMP family transporter
MGEWVNPRWFNLLAWIAIAFIIGISLVLGADTINDLRHV